MGKERVNIGSSFPEDTIIFFEGEYEFLSNFYESEVMADGELYPTAEHAYQIMKNDTPENIEHVKTLTAGQVKRYMRKQEVREDWEKLKVLIMYDIVKDKFTRHKDLQERLIGTGNRVLVGGNYWGDHFWGVCEGEGLNYLGIVLMIVRSELQGEGGEVDLKIIIEQIEQGKW